MRNAGEAYSEAGSTVEAPHRAEPGSGRDEQPRHNGAPIDEGDDPHHAGREQKRAAKAEEAQSEAEPKKREPEAAFSSEPRLKSTGMDGHAEEEVSPPRRGWWNR
jgi:hypothetical protein